MSMSMLLAICNNEYERFLKEDAYMFRINKMLHQLNIYAHNDKIVIQVARGTYHSLVDRLNCKQTGKEFAFRLYRRIESYARNEEHTLEFMRYISNQIRIERLRRAAAI
jgi:hypothetical protein